MFLVLFSLVNVCVWVLNRLSVDGNASGVGNWKDGKVGDDGALGGWKGEKVCGGGGKNGCWRVIVGGAGRGSGCCEKNDGGEGGNGDSERFLLLLSLLNLCLFFNLFNVFLMTKSTPDGPGAFFISSLATCFLPTSSSFSKEPTIGFSASNVEMFSKTSSRGLNQAFA